MLRSMCKKHGELARMENLLKLSSYFVSWNTMGDSSKIVKEYASNSSTSNRRFLFSGLLGFFEKVIGVTGCKCCGFRKPNTSVNCVLSDITIGNN